MKIFFPTYIKFAVSNLSRQGPEFAFVNVSKI